MPQMIVAPATPASPQASLSPRKPCRPPVEQQLPSPTNATPGTPEKIAILKGRMERGLALHHPEDRAYDPPAPEAEPTPSFAPPASLARGLGTSPGILGR